jgi:hypothetical protein
MNSRLLSLIALTLTASSSIAGTTLTQKWHQAAGSAAYLTTGNTERGIAFLPGADGGADKLLLATRASYAENGGTAKANRIVALDPTTGSFLESRLFTSTEMTGGTFVMSMIGVADDGAIYVANLTTSATVPLKIYRLSDLTATVTIAYSGNPDTNRWGDTLAVTGAGTSTKIALSSGGNSVVVLTTQDGSTFSYAAPAPALSPSSPVVFPSMGEGGGASGISFGNDTFPANDPATRNLIWTKANGATKKTRAHKINLLAEPPTSSLVSDTALAPSANNRLTGLFYDFTSRRLGGLETANGVATPHKIVIWDGSTPSSGPAVLASAAIPTAAANGNAIGSTVIRNDVFYVCDTNNGIAAFDIITTPDVTPPTVTVQPTGASVFEGGQVELSIAAEGSPPLSYKWVKDGSAVPGATNRILLLNPVAASSAGSYVCEVRNAATTFATSNAAVITTVPPVANTNALTKCWEIKAGTVPFFGTADAERGVDVSTDGAEVYLVSRSTNPPSLQVLDGATGAPLRALDTNATTIAGGIYTMNMCGTDDAGKLYVGNLTTDSTTANFRIYQWDNSSTGTAPSRVYDGNPFSARIGDSFDVRGSGEGDTGVQIAAAGANTTKKFTIFTKDTFTGLLLAKVFEVPEVAAGSFGLSVAFGEGNTLYGKGSGTPLIKVAFDLTTGLATLVKTIPTTAVPAALAGIGVDEKRGILVASHVTNSDNARLFRLGYHPDAPVETTLDQEFYTLNNVNLNNVGSAVIRGTKAFLLNANNALACYNIVVPKLRPVLEITKQTTAGKQNLRLLGNFGETYTLERSTSLTTGTWIPGDDVGITNIVLPVEVDMPAGDQRVFWRAKLVP